jgi:hypothetical protein
MGVADTSVKPMDQREFWLTLPLIIRNLVRCGYIAAYLVCLYCLQGLIVLSRLSEEEFNNYISSLGYLGVLPESILFSGKFVLVSYIVFGTLIKVKKSRIVALVSVCWMFLFCSQSPIFFMVIFLIIGTIGIFWYQYEWGKYKQDALSRGMP